MEFIAKNRKAYFQYEILEKIEAGIVLTGTEVKSVRNRDVSINESFAHLNNGEIFVYEMHVGQYKQGNRQNHEPKRVRKLLLHKREIAKIAGKIKQKGYTMIPLSIYFKDGIVKVELALVRGKSKVDKREDIKKRDIDREIQRAMR
ncbi:MAG TPA: SsrA-binding protein SmpB [Candidatus Wunengus sp. YC64]|uniref:SsrA-binding protein SmpB n=1 Tax=unclassified Candidatus Wunengus TaxID=3367695 RepID=UPI0008C1DADF|nr:SsrA-binding protein SmpB [Planctomycetota bacterium]OHB42908.1 MAG: SsrA-binding protein [Planctomycetes bacterium GWB2_41_19]